jgi:hypothetical protein
MRESRTYGSGRGACHETHVPTATTTRVYGKRLEILKLAVPGLKKAGLLTSGGKLSYRRHSEWARNVKVDAICLAVWGHGLPKSGFCPGQAIFGRERGTYVGARLAGTPVAFGDGTAGAQEKSAGQCSQASVRSKQ